MADYNIYIHALGGGNPNYNPTVPWSKRPGSDGTSQTSSKGDAEGPGIASMITKGASYAQNPDAIVGNAVSAAAKAAPWVAAAVAVIKLGIAVVDFCTDWYEIESGNPRQADIWRDTKQTFNNILNPVASITNHAKLEHQWHIEQRRINVEEKLLGGSVINSYTRRGV